MESSGYSARIAILTKGVNSPTNGVIFRSFLWNFQVSVHLRPLSAIAWLRFQSYRVYFILKGQI